MFLNIYEGLAEGIANIIDLIGSWNWVDISTQIKNWVLSGSGLVVLGLFVKTVIPLLRNSNKPILAKIAVLTDKIQSMENLTRSHPQRSPVSAVCFLNPLRPWFPVRLVNPNSISSRKTAGSTFPFHF